MARPNRIKGLTLLELFIVVLVLIVLVIFVLPRPIPVCGTRSPVSRTQADLRSLATCIESYYVDNSCYPVAASGVLGANNVPGAKPEVLALSTFRVKSGPNDPLYTLTTPISYCTSYFSDPFAKTKRATFGYWPTTATLGNGTVLHGWIMWSAGPDKDYDIAPETLYTPGPGHPSAWLIDKTYDPTNGTTSNGDVWRAKQ